MTEGAAVEEQGEEVTEEKDQEIMREQEEVGGQEEIGDLKCRRLRNKWKEVSRRRLKEVK